MTRLKTLYKQTFIYGLATVMPKLLSFLLVRLHTDRAVLKNVSDYGDVSLIFAYFVVLNVILSYGMETSFFRFFSSDGEKDAVLSTSTISLLLSSAAAVIFGYCFKEAISNFINIDVSYLVIVLWILFFDALVIIPFAYLRALGKPVRYTWIKFLNTAINLGLNILFLIFLKSWAQESSFWQIFYKPNFEVHYIFIANLIASSITFLLFIGFYFNINYKFSIGLWKKMVSYALPILVAGIAFSINEAFDRVLLEYLLPKDISRQAIGTYSACYKLALFMTLFGTAYRLGIEPFFFSSVKAVDAKKKYSKILEVFVILSSLILLCVVVFVDLLKLIVIPNDNYWEAMSIVPILLLAYLFLGIYHTLSVWYKVTDQTKYGAIISIIGALLTLVINILFIPKFGYYASAFATLVAYFTMASISYLLCQKYYIIPYNLRKICFYIISSIGLSALSFYKFREQYLTGIFLIFILIILILVRERENFRQLISSRHES